MGQAQPNKPKSTRRPADEARQVRKKQNREAQLAYRGRKRAAEEAQKDRVQRLEAIVEQMSSVFTDFADEFMGFEDLKRHKGLVSSFTRTTRAMVALAAEAVDGADVEEPPASVALDIPWSKNKPGLNMPSPKHDLDIDMPRAKRQRSDDVSSDEIVVSRGWRTCVDPRRSWKRISEPTTYPTHLPWSPQIFGNGWLSSHSPLVDMAPPRGGRFVIPDTFAYRLVEHTLFTIYDCLLDVNGAQIIHDNFVLWWALKDKTREQTLVHLRWMLGRGRHTLYRAVDIPAEHYARLLSEEKNRKLIKCEGDADDGFPGVEITELPTSRAYLNALEVQQKLEQLVGKPLDEETINFTFPGNYSSAGSSPEYGNTFDYSQGQSDGMDFQLNVPQLMNNLVTMSVCLIVGPGFYHDGLSKAVEAALIPLR